MTESGRTNSGLFDTLPELLTAFDAVDALRRLVDLMPSPNETKHYYRRAAEMIELKLRDDGNRIAELTIPRVARRETEFGSYEAIG